ncbi:uncharacterized protein A1O9_05434 [Exophiala aquamarina CBS 119918]|uniref:Myb-like domain-containing protein n=1 Tax=Exophiala aquamarina CBS 119918 TaxID=1182545 RepID=A0A072PCK5_9EURO|nr:uncharacterized protein A1O9_05434 [Exophiala aquamarina CBS 119918]KEF57517.1 hypothetical protein A1O9_05434 [Exophiala aquamarina CBS 119918]
MNSVNNEDESHHLVRTAFGDEGEDSHNTTSDADHQGPSTTRPIPSPILQPSHGSKWNQLRQDYNDQYLEIFKLQLDPSKGEISTPDLPPTQLGAVWWRPSEKDRLYQALERRGRLDVEAIALLVRTKSEVEVNSYLSWLRQEETDRQLFETQTKNISHIDIPAAIEIGSGCEAVLDKAAAALSAFQEQFDFAAGQRNHGVWLIDPQTASELDKAADEAELSSDLSEGDGGGDFQPDAGRTRLFYTSTFLKLSERFYMNQGSGETWHELGENNERPALTMDVLIDFYEMIVSYLRRLVQSIIFIAKSRIRSTSTISYSTLHTVRQEDVVAALDILNINDHLWEYWIHMARRNKLLVVHKNVKRFNPDAVMDYDKVEEILSERKRSRSLSAMSGLSDECAQSDGSLAESGDGDEDAVLPEDEADVSEPGMELGRASSTDEGMVDDNEGDEFMSLGSEDGSHNIRSGNSPAKQMPSSKRKRALAIEAETDEYMEKLDQMARVQEESRLLHLLGVESEKAMEEEEIEIPRKRPRVMRKTVAETKGWSAAYQSEWELHKEPVHFNNPQIPAGGRNEADLE